MRKILCCLLVLFLSAVGFAGQTTLSGGGGTSLGKHVKTVGTGQRYTSVADAVTDASTGDTILCLPGVEMVDPATIPAGVKVEYYDARYDADAQPTKLDVVTGGTFTRNSLAYQLDNVTPSLACKAVNTRRTRSVLSISEPTGTRLDAAGKVAAFVYTNGKFYGRGNDSSANSQKIYTSADGATWTAVKTFTGTYPVGVVVGLWPLQNSRVLAMVKTAAATRALYWTSGSDDTTWTIATNTAGGNASLPGDSVNWSFCQRAATGSDTSGPAVIGTYYAQTNTSDLWRTANNGESWTLVHQFPVNVVTHIHAVAYHAGTGKWIASTGDTVSPTYRQLLLVSTDDGVTWDSYAYFDATAQDSVKPRTVSVTGTPWKTTTTTDGPNWPGADAQYRPVKIGGGTAGKVVTGWNRLDGTGTSTEQTLLYAAATEDDTGITITFPKNTPTGQDTRYVDYGDATKILVGSDWNHRVCLLDLTTWAVTPLWNETNRGNLPARYTSIFTLFLYDGLWYACTHGQQDSTVYDGRTIAVYVSSDLANWQLYHRSAVSDRIESVYGYLGAYGGTLYLSIKAWNADTSSLDFGTYSLTPAKTSLQTGCVLTPAKRNYLTETISKLANNTGWAYAAGTPPAATAVLDATKAIAVTGNAALTSVGALKYTYGTPPFAGGNTNYAAADYGLSLNGTYVADCWTLGGKSRTASLLLADSGGTAGRSFYAWAGAGTWARLISGPYVHVKAGNTFGKWTWERDPSDETIEGYLTLPEVTQAPYGSDWTPGSITGTIDSVGSYSGGVTVITDTGNFTSDLIIGQEIVCAGAGGAFRVTARSSDNNTITVSGDASGESGAYYTRQAAESLSWTQTLPTEFTHVFAAEIMPSCLEFGDNRLYLMTYKVSATEYVYLYAELLASETEVTDWVSTTASSHYILTSENFAFTNTAVGQIARLRDDAASANAMRYGFFRVVAVDSGSNSITVDTAAGSGGSDVTGITGTTYDLVFGLETVTSGSASGSPIHTANHPLHRFQAVRFAVRYCDGTLKLSVMDGTSVEHVATALTRTGAVLHGADRTILTGDINGANCVPMTLLPGYLYGQQLPTAKIEDKLEAFGAW